MEKAWSTHKGHIWGWEATRLRSSSLGLSGLSDGVDHIHGPLGRLMKDIRKYYGL